MVRAELPGIDPERDAEITVRDGMLTIRGERRQRDRVEGKRYLRMETAVGAFERTVPLPEDVDEDEIEGTYRDGILEVVIPKAAAVTPVRRIPIQAGGATKALGRGRRKKAS